MHTFGKRLLDRLDRIQLPSLTKEVPVAVYVIHNSRDPEDYFFLFDFEEFVSASNAGFFARPKLHLFAGRDDFSRLKFARQFREVFATEFDNMRNALAQQKKSGSGWLSFGWDLGAATLLSLRGVIPTLVLGSALAVGGSLWMLFGRGKSSAKRAVTAQSVGEEIEKTKSQVEDALTRIEVTVHPELHDFAWRDGPRGPIGGMDRNAWPLPDYVRAHLSDGKSGSWW
ncbi:hypothetical protein ACMU_09255 [Actibacterium mucosum KCTC 23349]|uniref:Uncharacterized protein n=1 Tax=Actibacterium mucosum KCTC 23349 TaxID=1454373 RepID=A0A037ZK85_9RHOB|nr:hypothetical protein [Actibacterium mucosum]KAJ55942.1 hypothetical protein ACMU_09255 [Actibacterium mucosum KCTC 23349]